MSKDVSPAFDVFGMSGLSRSRRIVLIVLRILALIGIIAFVVMYQIAIRDYRPYYKGFFSGLAILLVIIPELALELFIRDFPHRGIRNISRKVRVLLTPLIYGVGVVLSPFVFHLCFRLLAERGRSPSAGELSSLQKGLWLVLIDNPAGRLPLVLLTLYLLLVTLVLCYVVSSASGRRRWTAIALFFLLEAAAALGGGNSPG